jgi:hypothetical protein
MSICGELSLWNFLNQSRGTKTLRSVYPAIAEAETGLVVGDFYTALEKLR